MQDVKNILLVWFFLHGPRPASVVETVSEIYYISTVSFMLPYMWCAEFWEKTRSLERYEIKHLSMFESKNISSIRTSELQKPKNRLEPNELMLHLQQFYCTTYTVLPRARYYHVRGTVLPYSSTTYVDWLLIILWPGLVLNYSGNFNSNNRCSHLTTHSVTE